jgi:hypothetical protein
MTGSNQRPLPGEVKAFTSQTLAVVQRYPQIGAFSLRSCRPCSSLFVWVTVLIGVLRVRGGGESLLRVVASQ